jgi:regulator of protease activity HflC (stomatin/prohibitin superfamily)
MCLDRQEGERRTRQYRAVCTFGSAGSLGSANPGSDLIIPIIDRLWRVSMRILMMPIQSQGIITRDNVSVDIAAVGYFRVSMRANSSSYRHSQIGLHLKRTRARGTADE